MHIWIISWIEGTTPIVEVFTDLEQATQCVRFMAENKSGLTMKHIEIQEKEKEKTQPEEEPEAE